jgi:hypothetical protein
MSSLRPGDENLHHADGSHRWSGGPPDPRGRAAYLAALRDHLQQHRRWTVPAKARQDPRRRPR